MNRKEKIFVLKAYKHGESDLIVHGLNSLGAQISFIARGGLKSRKRFAGGVLEPTHYIEVTYKERLSNDGDPLHHLVEAQIIREFSKLRTDYSRLEAALYIIQLVHRMGQQGTVDSPDLFNLLGNALQAAEMSENLENLRLQFELKLLATQGVLPHESAFLPWLKPGLAQHGDIKSDSSSRHWVAAQATAHLRHYLGSFRLPQN